MGVTGAEAAGRQLAEVERMKVVVLEDWNHFFPGVPSLERLRARVAVEVQHD